MIGENRALVGLAIPIRVFQDKELVIHFVLGFPVRIGRPYGHPEAALRVKGHLDRLGEIGELLF